MKSKSLNLPEALQLANVLDTYVILPGDNESDTNKFVGRLVEQMSPMDYLLCVKLLSADEITGSESGIELLQLLHEGFEKNKVLSLVEYFRGIGI